MSNAVEEQILRGRLDDRHLARAAAKLSEDAFREVWDNDDDASDSL